MICFICKINYQTFSALAFHYKCMHCLGPLSTYECSEINCSQTFQNLNGLRRHITRKHNIININNAELNSITQLKESHISTYSKPLLSDNVNNFNNNSNSTSTSNTNVFNLKEAIDILNTSAVKFSLQLHNNNNFSRKDILSIQNEICVKILNPIVNLLKGSLEDKIKDPLLLSTTNIVISEISGLFKLCNSEYRLNKWLANQEITADIIQFTINNEINIVSVAGETEYDEIKTKGILFPLKFQFKKYYEKDNMLNQVLELYDNLNTTEDYISSNFIQGSCGKKN